MAINRIYGKDEQKQMGEKNNQIDAKRVRGKRE